jgi:hypothetical protein
MTLLSGAYATGTASIANGSKTVTLAGGITSSLVPGDIFQAGNGIGMIDSVTDTLHFLLTLPWAAPDVTAGVYQVTYLAAQRTLATFNGQKTRQLLALLDGIGVMYYVPATQSMPDPANGNDGDFAIKIVPGSAWTFWIKRSGVWVSLGQPVGVANQGLWDPAYSYGVNDIVSRLGVLYIALLANTNLPPESSATYWSVLLQGGNLFPLAFDASDRPDSGDTFRRFVFPVPVQFVAGMTGSVANALIGATATAVISIRKNGTQFATITFAAVGAAATMTIASPGVITDTAHGLLANATVLFTTTGRLPAGLNAGTVYYILTPTTDTYQLAATQGGTAIATSGSQVGTHTRFTSSIGTVACPSTTTFAKGDILDMLAPNPRDGTLATLAITLLGYR